MKFKRRGFRRGTVLKPRVNPLKPKDSKQPFLISPDEFFDQLAPLLRPNFKGNIPGLSGIYQTCSKEQQKNLTDKIAGQILFAHRDIVRDIFKRLSQISLDLAQQTEVAYRRLKLVDRFF